MGSRADVDLIAAMSMLVLPSAKHRPHRVRAGAASSPITHSTDRRGSGYLVATGFLPLAAVRVMNAEGAIATGLSISAILTASLIRAAKLWASANSNPGDL